MAGFPIWSAARAGNVVLSVLAAGASVLFLYVLVSYGRVDGYLDHAESNVALLSWYLLDGKPIYPDPDVPAVFLNT